jgi:hypothetical protein
MRYDTPSPRRNSSNTPTSSPGVYRDPPTHSSRSGSQESYFGSGSGSSNKVRLREDLNFGSSSACKAQYGFHPDCEYAEHTLWTASGHVDGFSDVLLQWKNSELESYLPHGETDSLIIFPIRNAVPGENKPWDQVTGHERTAPRRRANSATISQPVQHYTPAPTTRAAGPSTGYGRDPMNALLDPNLAPSSERPQPLATNPLNSNIHFNPDLGWAFQPGGNMWNPSLDSPWVLP